MSSNAYKQAGVDTDAGASLVKQISNPVAATHRSGVMTGLGGFGAFFDLGAARYTDPVLVSSTDGVGTKLKLAIDMDDHSTVGQDLVAMCANDIAVHGAEPLFFLDYYASGRLDVDAAASVITGIARACEQINCALIGGETAEMPGLYAAGDYDLAGFCVGAAERANLITGEKVTAGDVIIGLASNGIHSNGLSLVRKILDGPDAPSLTDPAPFNRDIGLGQAFLTTTRLYVKAVLECLKHKDSTGAPLARAMAHITGGGLMENIPRTLPKGTQARIDASAWELPGLFAWLCERGRLSNADLAATFNCGIGFTIVAARDHADTLMDSLRESGEKPAIIGRVEESGAEVPSIRIENMGQAWPGI